MNLTKEVNMNGLVTENVQSVSEEFALHNTSINSINFIKKKRTRRRPKKKKSSINVDEIDCASNVEHSISELLANIKITAVQSQTNGKVVRIKSVKNRHVCHNGNSCNNNTLDNVPSTSKTELTATTSKDNNTSIVEVKNGILSEREDAVMKFNNDLQNAGCSTKRKKQKRSKSFQPFLSQFVIESGLLSGELIKGSIRINVKNPNEAYISNNDSSEQDYLIQDVVDRNRALEGDVVVIKPKPKSEWTEKQITAVVVSISEKIHSRTAIGFIKSMPHTKKEDMLLFLPRDRRVPKIKVKANMCPFPFHKDLQKFENTLFRAKIISWDEVAFAQGIIVELIGECGDLEAETKALLIEHDLDVTLIDTNLLKYVDFTDVLFENEKWYREDLRKECIFTIDPSTARDLDDAVSCKKLKNGNLEIGVHISDVAYFLTEGTPLDKLIGKRATSVYLVNEVYHMLPRELCMFCSLLPGTEKRAFSVFWEMTEAGEIISHRFTRTLISSCAQLAYEHAQAMIDDPNRIFNEDELPHIFGGFTYKDLSCTINYLHKIACNLGKKRFENGALKIDQTKLFFRLDANTGKPIDLIVYQNLEAHRLIEEFMLLANGTVAQEIVENFPDLAFLRNHRPPNQRLLNDIQKMFKSQNIDIDISTSKELQKSISNLSNDNSIDNSMMIVINHFLAKPMTRALYFCSGNADDIGDFRHYALHIPIYTHFTSPIRRYADVMVHRLLAASLGYSSKPKWDITFVDKIAKICNKKKYDSKCAAEASTELYLAQYVDDHQPFEKSAIVIALKNCSFDVLVVETGTIIRIYKNALPDDIHYVQEEDESQRKLTLIFAKTSELPEEVCVIQLFAIVKLNLIRKVKSNKLEAQLLRPIKSQSFKNQSRSASYNEN